MAITNAQQAKQLLANGGDVLGPLGEDDLTNQLSPGSIGKIGRGLAFVLSCGLTSVPAVAKEILKQKTIDKVMEESANMGLKAETKSIQQDNRSRGVGGYQSDFAQDSGFMEGRGTAAEMGSFAVGGLADGNFDFESARQMYGLGKLVKKVTKTVKKIAKSPVGNAALLYAGTAGLGSIGSGQTGLARFAPSNFRGNLGRIGAFITGGKLDPADILGGEMTTGKQNLFQRAIGAIPGGVDASSPIQIPGTTWGPVVGGGNYGVAAVTE